MPDLKPLISYIVDQVNDSGGSVGRTALVKLVYLVEVEYYRQYGKHATGLQWLFHHYGPYAAELDTAVNSLGLGIDENQFSGKAGNRSVSGYRYRRAGDWKEIARVFNSHYDTQVKRCVDKVVEQWALFPLPTILDYVYFETEPMQGAKRGEYLDFSKIPIEPVNPKKTVRVKFSDAFVSDMRQRLRVRKEERESTNREARKATEPRYDEVYFDACKAMAAEEKSHAFRPGAKVKEPEEG